MLNRNAIEKQVFSAVLDYTELGIVVCDAKGILTLFNKRAEEMHRLPFAALPADAWARHYGMYHSDGRTLMRKEETPLYRALQGGEVTDIEMVLRRGDAEPKMVLASGRRIEIENQTVGAVVAMHDITEKKLIEIRLRQTHKMEAIGQLAAGIAHEINNPTQFITNNVRFLADALRAHKAVVDHARSMVTTVGRADLIALLHATEEAQDFDYIQSNYPVAVDQTIQGLSHITSIVGAMNEFARPQPGGWETANINPVLENVLLIARNAYRELADVEFHLGAIRPVPCCLSELNQVFLSLIINATQAIGEVVGSGGQRGRITIRTEMEGDRVRIEIGDTGCGIPEAIRHRVFDPFFTTKEVGKGTGQGLAIAWAVIVNRHQGTVMFQSEVGQGTTFIIRLPCPELE